MFRGCQGVLGAGLGGFLFRKRLRLSSEVDECKPLPSTFPAWMNAHSQGPPRRSLLSQTCACTAVPLQLRSHPVAAVLCPRSR